MGLRFATGLILAAFCSVGMARAAPPLASYGRLPALDLVRLSPSGNRIAFVAVTGENRKLFVRKVDGEAMLVNDVGTSKVRDIEWAGEDFLLISGSATLKFGTGLLNKWNVPTRAELPILLIANLKTGHISRALDQQHQDTFLGEASPLGARQIGGLWYEFVEVYKLDHGVYIYRIDLDSGRGAMMPGFNTVDEDFLIGSDGALAARGHYDEPTKTWNLYAGDHGKQLVVGRRSVLDLVGIDGLGRSPGTLLVNETDLGADTIDEYPTSPGSTPTPLFQGQEVDELVRDPNSHLLIGAILGRGAGAVFFDPKLQARYDAVRRAFPGYQVKLESYSADFGKLVVETSGGDDSGTYWLVDMTTSKAQDLMPAYPDIGPKDVGPTSLFKYAASDGLALEGVLTLPPGSSGKALPLVVIPHGGPIGASDKLGFDYWAQAFASRGYAVFQPNYRGSGGYGAALRQAGYGQWGHRMLTDTSDGVLALAKAGVIDPERVCIAGASYGGYAAMAGVTVQHGVYRCAVAVSGVSDVGALMAADGAGDDNPSGRYTRALFGANEPYEQAIVDISPLRHAEAADAPILLVHGKDDTTVPFVHSLGMNTRLLAAGKTVQFLPLEGEDHFWSREKTRVEILEATVSFVERYNPVR